MHTVTVGIPFRNPGQAFVLAVRSVFAQTHTDWELILQDDGSTDGSLELAAGIVDSRVRVFSDGVGRGLSVRLNQIAALAQGQFLARMDADDMMHPDRIARQMEVFCRHPDTDVVGTAAYCIDADHQLLGVRGMRRLDTSPLAVLMRGICLHPTIMAKTSWFRAHPYETQYLRGQDRDLWCRTAALSSFAKIPEPLYFYREGRSVCLRKYLSSLQTERQILSAHGPQAVGHLQTVALIARSYAKSAAYIASSPLGVQHRLVAMRNRPLTVEQECSAFDALRIIAATAVPGFPDSGLHRAKCCA